MQMPMINPIVPPTQWLHNCQGPGELFLTATSKQLQIMTYVTLSKAEELTAAFIDALGGGHCFNH